jgi:hypothetical protein
MGDEEVRVVLDEISEEVRESGLEEDGYQYELERVLDNRDQREEEE